jgi:hypothetical protein
MSSIEFAKPTASYSYTFPAMVAGTITSVNLPNFFLGTSRVVGAVRTTSGGVVGTPFIASITAGAVGTQGCVLVLRSGNAGDTSTYTITWTNEVASALSNA